MMPVTNDEHYERLNKYPNKPPVGERWEVTEEIYWHFLEILPPLKHTGKEFYMSEFKFGNITSHYFIEDGRYYHEWSEI
jgi:hypothetical protein